MLSTFQKVKETLLLTILNVALPTVDIFTDLISITKLYIGTRVGHAYAKYAKYADYAHMRNMRMQMRIENLIHIFHIQREKNSLFKRQ